MSDLKQKGNFQDLFNKKNAKIDGKNTRRKLFEIGEITSIQAFKYDGTLYRQYEGAKIVANLEDFVVVLLVKTKVMEEKISWVVSDPILFFFAKNKFYNASITLNKSKNNYIYINLASPFFIDNGIIKYIDFDLDIKSYVDRDFNVIDWQDFKNSIVKYKYSLKLIYRLYDELDFLYEQHDTKNGIFSSRLIDGLERMLKESGDI
ncbi:DUF402 domain-containing protein [[Mycoplasma] falconis]|uniref:DUF402 domain-containing protein n=1 Tax=[Mycoplasma] falconis TaxID=92403 RepID=A0A501XAX6_9BACT|nr:DUF402 domain-containing protein [[Mycoplasma] falconis]TPE57701.1 DUF402 domain-containing protein [[Mycoplasma] falconis]